MAERTREHIVRLARRLRLGIWVVIAAIVLLYGAARLGLGTSNVRIVARAAVDSDIPELWWARDLAALLILAALVRLAGMLGLIARGQRFSPPVTRAFRGFALLLLLAAAVTLVAPFLALAYAEPTHGQLHIALNFRDVWTMFVTGALFLVANLLDEAQRLEADLSEIV
ncbi:DUF2975 domain-containing protein [Sphingomonas sp.]|uniref:DUF2975 domain-containing protein n=1 Tax=Sphingomonas sp. TaxID=28214 RepID=UPI001B09889B|nr:DUF2975 domain-containing protein [Sphingomonas sp.]MBO9711545.1 hypothetical protein [Sphingomonas sp.]